MRIHTNTLSREDVLHAARVAGASIEVTTHGSRKRDHAFNVTLRGGSNRRPNTGKAGADNDEYAATWDQWGVFIGVLYDRDPDAITPYYTDRDDFNRKTAGRFDPNSPGRSKLSYYWPADAHGDHTFRWDGTKTACTKCSATQRWSA